MKARRLARRWPWLLAVPLLAGAGLLWARRDGAAPPPIDPALLITARRGSLAVDVFETGKVVPRERVELKSKVAGQVTEVKVDEGSHVEKGQLVLVLDPLDAQRDVSRAEADVVKARVDLELAGLVLERKRQSVDAAVAPVSDLDAAKSDLHGKEATLKGLQVTLAAAQDRLRYTRIYAPMSGTVIQRGIQPGEVVVPGVQSTFDGKALLVVADLSTLIVKIDLNQIDVARVRLGQTAAVTLDALPGQTYEAVVTKISPARCARWARTWTSSGGGDPLHRGRRHQAGDDRRRAHPPGGEAGRALPAHRGGAQGGAEDLRHARGRRRQGAPDQGASGGQGGRAQRSRPGDRLRALRGRAGADQPGVGRRQRDQDVMGTLGMAARALRAHVFRSFLTVLSITIGTFAIVLMSSLAESGLATIRFGIEDLGGARLLLVAPRPPERAESKQGSYERGLSRRDREHLATALPHVAVQSTFTSLGTRDITSDTEETARTDLVAGDARFFEAFRMRLARGRLFTEEEDRQHARVCVAGRKLAKKLFRDDPLGHKVTIGGVRCRIVGELEDNERFGVGLGFDWVDLLVVPLETAADGLPEVRQNAAILVKTDDARHNEPVKRIANAVLEDRHHGVDDFTFYDFSSIMDKFSAVFAIMEAIVGLVAGVALLIGGIGVMNMMLVSVSERVREIGIRKALGATPADIRAQFLVEALLLSATGGALGVALGALAAVGATALIHSLLPAWMGGVSRVAAAVALLVSLGIGVFFGYFPARRAGRLDPTEAMRR